MGGGQVYGRGRKGASGYIVYAHIHTRRWCRKFAVKPIIVEGAATPAQIRPARMPRAARNILVRRRFQQANMANMAAGRRAHVLILLPLVLSATLEASATSRGDCLPETRVAAPGSACVVQHEGAGGGGGGEGAQMLRSDSESVAQSEGWIDFMDVEA